MKRKLIVIEGVDGTGKSTQAEILAHKMEAKLISQPSTDNCVHFIRAEAKKNPALNPFERQLLIGISHTVDAFTKFKGEHHIVMDRSYLSGMVYGEVSGVDKYNMALLSQILTTVYKVNVSDYDVHIVFLTADKRLDEADDDVFEGLSWNDLNSKYLRVHQSIASRESVVFSDNEKVSLISVSGKSIEQVTAAIEECVNAS